ncbi:hypothetical protein [Treponema sp. R80B11-R83G3]
MKKYIFIVFFFSITFSLSAFDRSLNGSWGLITDGEKIEFIRFNNNEVIIINTLFRATDYKEIDDTIYIDDFEGDSVIIQYYRLSPTKLLFIMWNTDNITQSISLILSKLG